LPLTDFTALEKLVLKLFFQKRVRIGGKFVTVRHDVSAAANEPFLGTRVRVRVRVLMAIGPRSGL
jgi:hypothetical protein